MITNKGKDIIAKYLIGQAPAYASYMALGSGPTPLGEDGIFDVDAYKNTENLGFEMFRVPITSRGYVTDLVWDETLVPPAYVEVSKLVLTAELPTEQRYEISEVGIYSAKSNPSATGKDSRIVYTFTESENWEYHDETRSSSLGSTISEPLDQGGDLIVEDLRANPVFRATSNNSIFDAEARTLRYERPRFLNSSVFVPGDMSFLQVDANSQVMAVKTADSGGYYGTHVHLAGISLDLSKNSPEDELKVAFSVINKNVEDTNDPSKVFVLLEFSSTDANSSQDYARFPIEVISGLESNRYIVETKKLKDLVMSPTFSWSNVKTVKIYVTIIGSSNSQPSADYYVALDALRFENTSSINPLYGLSGYSVVKTFDAKTMVKEANSSNMVEFRFGLDVK
jgi:hypothetical protein